MQNQAEQQEVLTGEVDVMIADVKDRRKGIGRAAVEAFLFYIVRQSSNILREYAAQGRAREVSDAELPELKALMAKINVHNEGSIALFKSLGFKQQGKANYFGELTLQLKDFKGIVDRVPAGYVEARYTREI
jgi:RimJ/RimL family protein N-acetyltransferase